MRISKLDHLVLVTGDLSRCVSFYRDLLHMEAEEKDGRFALRFGTSKSISIPVPENSSRRRKGLCRGVWISVS